MVEIPTRRSDFIPPGQQFDRLVRISPAVSVGSIDKTCASSNSISLSTTVGVSVSISISVCICVSVIVSGSWYNDSVSLSVIDSAYLIVSFSDSVSICKSINVSTSVGVSVSVSISVSDIVSGSWCGVCVMPLLEADEILTRRAEFCPHRQNFACQSEFHQQPVVAPAASSGSMLNVW